MLILENGDYLFSAWEVYYLKGSSLGNFGMTSIYRMDSAGQLKWSYHVADTAGEYTGTSNFSWFANSSNTVLWHNSFYATTFNFNPASAWLMKFNVDGSDLGIGLEEEKALAAFSLYPNPAGEVAFVLLPFVPSGESHVEIHNLAGQKVASQTFTERDNLLKVSLNLPPGSYLLKVSSGGYEATKPLVVE